VMPCESLGKSLQTCLSQDKSGFPDVSPVIRCLDVVGTGVNDPVTGVCDAGGLLPSSALSYCSSPDVKVSCLGCSNLRYLPTKPENVEYLWNVGMHTCCLFWPFTLHNSRFKQALDHKKWWRIEQSRVSTYQTRKCRISLECRDAQLSYILAL
jgi:hypothetical protein